MARFACLFALVLLGFVPAARAEDLPPGTLVRLGDNRFRAGGEILHLAISPDAAQFATAQFSKWGITLVTIWNAKTGRPVREQKVNTQLFRGFVWTDNGGFAAMIRADEGMNDKPAKLVPDDFRIWNFTNPDESPPPMLGVSFGFEAPIISGRLMAERPEKSPEYHDFLFSGNGKRVAARWENDDKHAIHVFEVKPTATAAKLTRAGTIDLGAEGADSVHISADGKTFVTFRKLANADTAEGTATTWDIATGKPAKPVRVPWANRLMVTPDARTLVVYASNDDERGFDSIDLVTGKRRKLTRWRFSAEQLDMPSDSESSGFAFTPNGRVLAVAVDRKTFLIDIIAGKELGKLEGHAETPHRVAVSADGSCIATADRHGLIRLWDANSLRALHDAPGHRAPVEHAELSSDGKRLLTWAQDETVRLWDVATGKELRAFTGALASTKPTFALNGTAIIYSTEKKQIARDLQTGLEVPLPQETVKQESRVGLSLTSPRFTVEVTANSVQLREAATGHVRRELRGQRGEVRVLGFTPDGSRLITAGGDHTILVWDMRLQNVPLPDALKKETDAAKLWNTLATGKAQDAYLAMSRLARDPEAAVKMAKMKLKPATKNDRDTDEAKVDDSRAIELLESLDTDDSREVLKELARGHADAFRTQEAKRALERNKR